MPESSDQQANDGKYVVVARRYRPRGFEELVGQEHVARALKNAIETGRVGHAYLFTGARGVGKTSTARIFAKALNDPDGPTATPDNTTDVALAIDSGEDVDVIEIDGASNRGIDEIRSLRANVGVRPSRCRYKIYIIDEVHMLTPAAFNALLKTLEEPPGHVKFIFCTTDPEKIPITVLSRCQRFDFAPVEVSKIIQRLSEIVEAESAEADAAALELIARRAAGSMRDSQSLLEQVLSFSDGKLTADQVHEMLGTADDERLHRLAVAMADRNPAEALLQLDGAIDAGVDAGRLAEQLLGYFRDLMAVAVGCDASLLRHTSAGAVDDLKQLADSWGLQTVLAVVGLIDETLVRIRQSVYARVLLEATLIQICRLPDLQNIADLAAAAGSALPAVPAKSSSAARQNEKKKPGTTHRVDPSTEVVPSGPAPGLANSAPNTAVAATRHSEPETRVATQPAEQAHSATAVLPSPPGSADSVTPEPEPAEPVAWDTASARRAWSEALSQIGASMTGSLARGIQQVDAVGKNTLCLTFPADASLTMQRCELPEHKSALVKAVSQSAGRSITLEFNAATPTPEPKQDPAAANRPSRAQLMRDIESNDLVKSCIEMFEAQIVKVDIPR